MRKLSIPFMEDLAQEHNLPSGWWYSDADREALRAKALNGRMDQDLWVFAYGSLMWDPAIHFAEVRRARIEGFARKFILLETNGGRGTKETPGPMAALDHGDGCDGLAFRIARDISDHETEILWRREQIQPAYLPIFLNAKTPQGDVEVLTFVADHSAKDVHPEMTRAEQVRLIATATGVVGSAADYLRNIVRKLELLGIEDKETTTLLDEVERFNAE